jgi:hypothetical protein
MGLRTGLSSIPNLRIERGPGSGPDRQQEVRGKFFLPDGGILQRTGETGFGHCHRKENRPETHREAAESFGTSGLGEPEYTEAAKDRGRVEKREARLGTQFITRLP